ncbi:MAG: M23 family metallopeptidase [Clostridium sp.]|nr:M23 family metallopeptidase [Clostridium sp.]MCM1546981.1 M23 family metallopeptidase [Ruminococcus sp.]
MDIAGGGIAGATVTAAGSGTVIVAKSGCTHNYGKDGSCGCGGGYGNYVVIDHGDGISTLYGHCASICVSVGQYVSAGEAIGYVGSTGWSTGFHTHFEVMVNGSKVDPSGYLY